jgi:hypothetical protein
MKHKAATCPICGQMIADAAAQARIKQKLADLNAENAATLRSQEKVLEARFAAERKDFEKAAKEKAQKSFEAKAAGMVEKARQDEKRKNDRLLEQATRQNEQYRRQLERMTAHERGDIGEAEIRRALAAEFPGDDIRPLAKSRGAADIRHEVRDQGRVCGVIVYEVKNVATWQSVYLKQVRRSLTVVGGSQAVLVSTAFPRKQKYLAFEKDVAIVHPSIVASVVRTLREVLIVRAASTGGQAERERRADQLLQFVKGEEFVRNMKVMGERLAELTALQAKERRQHDQVWETQNEIHRAIERSHTSIETRIGHIAAGTSLALVRGGDGHPLLPASK